jgi:hypothetical protein
MVHAFKVQVQLYKAWWESKDSENATAAVKELLLVGSEASRLYKSYYRRHVYTLFGSLEWLHAVIALGALPVDFVEMVRVRCGERAALALAQGNNRGPRQSKREDRDPSLPAGLQHKVSEAKELREKAKLIDKKIFHENARWEQGNSRMAGWEWQKLLAAREEAWDRAEAVSRSTGFPFKDRDGNWVNDIQRDLVGLALCEWCRKHGLEYS